MPDNRIMKFDAELSRLQMNCQLADNKLKYAGETLVIVV
jgi:hypothetical protein